MINIGTSIYINDSEHVCISSYYVVDNPKDCGLSITIESEYDNVKTSKEIHLDNSNIELLQDAINLVIKKNKFNAQ